ncbi:LysR family transcriptional regulator [Herbaspirillum robiniae]|uniref:LysR family transcriptional regulator n=1 Tax=Herbaspirillum robiniae TaxID=2014887 RepID=A0ABX2LW55_9BURK|nr:LysR family transcriptional regulator [Herbaspirillum robiniae]NUU02720.1 LysR family transcriptional regulator [Herbaspirillum robiniae]
MRPTFDIDALRTIVVATELGSFARAAIHLSRSQSAVSMQLKRLEEQVGHALFQRNGRGMVPTESGQELLAYARKILELHDEAAAAVGAATRHPTVRLGLPQDFFEDVMPESITRFARLRPGTHVDVRAGRNHALEAEVSSGRLDMAIAFFEAGLSNAGTLLASIRMSWLGAKKLARLDGDRIPLVLFDHPCLFRQTALQALDSHSLPWRLALTTPSLPGVWSALRFGLGITVRAVHRIPASVCDVGQAFHLPALPEIELRLLTKNGLSPAASELAEILETVTRDQLELPA